MIEIYFVIIIEISKKMRFALLLPLMRMIVIER